MQRAFAELAPLKALLSGCLCFVAGTLVHTDRGLRTIEDIRAGDRVWSRDPASGAVAYKRVRDTFVSHHTRLYHVQYLPRRAVGGEDGEAVSADGDEPAELVTTETHPFFVVNRQAFIPAAALNPGDQLQLADGGSAVVLRTTIDERREPVTTYNLDVDDFHTYFVGREGVWVHNAGIPCEDIADLISIYKRLKAEGQSSSAILAAIESSAGKDIPRMGAFLEEIFFKVEFPDLAHVWTKGPLKSGGENAWKHFLDHVIDKGDVPNAAALKLDPLAFFKQVRQFVDHPPSPSFYGYRTSAFNVREEVIFVEGSDPVFAVRIISGDEVGAVKTYFTPIPKKGTPYQYFAGQVEQVFKR